MLKGSSFGSNSSDKPSTSDKPSSLKVERSGASHHAPSRLRFADEVTEETTPSGGTVQRSGGSLTTPGVLQRPASLILPASQSRPPDQPRPPAVGSNAALAARLAIMSEAGKEEADRTGGPRNIWEAAERGTTGFIVRQVERNVEFNINARDKLLRTALHWAVECNHKATVECLLDYNADVAATECNGRTVIHLASRAALPDMLKALLETVTPEQRDVLCNQADSFGITPVFMAYQKGEDGRRAFEVLVANGGRYNQKSSSIATSPSQIPATSPIAGSPTSGVGTRMEALRQQQQKGVGGAPSHSSV